MNGSQITLVICRVLLGDPESSTFHIRLGSLQQLIRIYYIRFKVWIITNDKFTKPSIQVLQTMVFAFLDIVG
jgi:hypothetical protein